MKIIYSLLLLLCVQQTNWAQDVTLDEINTTRCKHTFNGMIAFSSWTGANLIAGTAGYFTTAGELKHFFEMNIYFNLINAAIAVPGIIGAVKAKPTGLNFEQTVKESHKIQTIYLVNGVLDLAYITTGFLFRAIGDNQTQQALRDRWKGYGDSFIVQGSFLLLYDFIAFGIHAKNGKRLNQHWKKLSFSPYGAYGMGLSCRYNLAHSTKPNLNKALF